MTNKEQQAERALLAQYKLMHEERHFQGIGCFNFYQEIQQLVTATQSRTLLDYGCGKGRQFIMEPWALHRKLGVYCESWQEVLGVDEIVGYDPAYPPYAYRPEQTFDGVYCCSVLEHLLESQVPTILADIFAYARKFVFLGVGTTPAKKMLPDGRNAHITIQSLSWWETQVTNVATHFPALEWHLRGETDKESDGK